MVKRGRKEAYARFSAKRFEMLARKGWTDQECADFFDINIDTLMGWKSRHPEFAEALKKWKSSSDYHVEKSLFERAIGYSHLAVKMFVIGGKVVKEEYIQHYPPDPTSMIFWLKNRQPEKWREKNEKPIGETIINIIRAPESKETKSFFEHDPAGGRTITIGC